MTTLGKIYPVSKSNSIFLYQENILPLGKYQQLVEFLESQQFKGETVLVENLFLDFKFGITYKDPSSVMRGNTDTIGGKQKPINLFY